MIGPLRSRGRGRSRNASPILSAAANFNPLTDWTTDPVHAVWASDPLWTPPADGGAVSSWRNGGTVGGDLAQATGSKQPTYRASTPAYNNAATVSFTADDVIANDIANIAQTFWIVVVGNTAGGTGIERIVGIGAGEVASNGAGLGDNSAGTYSLRAGTVTLVGGTTDANPHLLVATYAGAASSLTKDGTSIASGTTGTGSMTVFALGAATDDTLSSFSYYLTGNVALALVFTTDPTSQAEWSAFEAWVTSFYGITVA